MVVYQSEDDADALDWAIEIVSANLATLTIAVPVAEPGLLTYFAPEEVEQLRWDLETEATRCAARVLGTVPGPVMASARCVRRGDEGSLMRGTSGASVDLLCRGRCDRRADRFLRAARRAGVDVVEGQRRFG